MSNRTLGFTSFVIAAAIPLFMVLFAAAAAAGMPRAAQTDPALAADFFVGHPAFVAALYLNSIVLHLAVMVLAVGLYERFGPSSPSVAAIGAVGGFAWAVLDIAQSSIGYTAILSAPSADPVTVDAISKGIQNAAHLFGGIWVLSIAVASARVFGRAHRAVALVVGVVFALHTLTVPVAPGWWALEYVGLPVFFAWSGVALVRGGREAAAARAARLAQA